MVYPQLQRSPEIPSVESIMVLDGFGLLDLLHYNLSHMIHMMYLFHTVMAIYQL